jgi:type IV pilus assembly protein PilM
MVQLGRKEVIGLDIGTTAVKIVQLHKDRKDWMVAAAGVAEVSTKGDDSPSRKEANIQRAIQNCVRVAGVKSSFAVCAVGGPEVAVRSFDFPKLEDDEIANAVVFEARQVCPFPTNDISVDYQLCPKGSDRSGGYLVAATNKLIKSRGQLTKKGKLDCVLMDVEGLALLNCFCEVEKPSAGHGTAVLNIGGVYTTLAIQGDDGQPFIRNINFGIEDIIKLFAAQNNLTHEQAKNNLIEQTKEYTAQITEILHKAGEPLIADISKTIRYYGAQKGCFVIEKILLCGGGAMLDCMVQMLIDGLAVKVELWNPLQKLHCQSRVLKGVLLKNIVHKSGHSMAIAAGLAMRAI